MSAREGLIAVAGATGRQGGAVVRHLLADGWRVRALTRDPRKEAARRLEGLGAQVVRADMANLGTLGPAFRGASGVFNVQNPMISGIEGEIAQGRNVAEAARSEGVQHVVYGSAGLGFPTGVPSWDSKLAVQRHLEALELPLTVLRPMAFMELMTDRGFFPPVAVWHLMPKLMGADRPVYWLSTDDLGGIAARAFAEPERFVGADLRLASDVRTIDECRAIWRDVVGRAPRRVPMPLRMFERFVGPDLPTMWRWLHDNAITEDVGPTYEIRPEAVTVREWLERHVTAKRR